MVPYTVPLEDKPGEVQHQLVPIGSVYGNILRCHAFTGLARVIVTTTSGAMHHSMEAAMSLAYHVVYQEAVARVHRGQGAELMVQEEQAQSSGLQGQQQFPQESTVTVEEVHDL